jgi:hypothetical protein
LIDRQDHGSLSTPFWLSGATWWGLSHGSHSLGVWTLRVTSVLQYHDSVLPSLTKLALIQSSLLALSLGVVTLENQNLFTFFSSPFLIQLQDAHDLIKLMTIAANVMFQDRASPDEIDPFQRSAIEFNLTIWALVKQLMICIRSIDPEVVCLSDRVKYINPSSTIRNPLISQDGQPLNYFGSVPALWMTRDFCLY